MLKKVICEICGKHGRINHISEHIKRYHKELDLFSSEIKIIEYILDRVYSCEDTVPLIAEYTSGVSADEIAKKYNISKGLFVKLMHLKNIQVRGIKEANGQKFTKDKVKKYFVEKFGVDNPSKVEEIKQKKTKTHVENFGSTNNFGIKEILDKAKKRLKEKYQSTEFIDAMKEKYKKTLRERYGDKIKNVSQIKSVREKISSSHKEICRKMSKEEKFQMTLEARKSMANINVSKIELQIQEALNILGIAYEKNKQIDKYNCDIVIGKKIVIEVQGDLFHANPSIYKGTDIIPVIKKMAFEIWGKDEMKKEHLRKNGFKVIWLWEKEIRRKSVEEVVELLEKNILEN